MAISTGCGDKSGVGKTGMGAGTSKRVLTEAGRKKMAEGARSSVAARRAKRDERDRVLWAWYREHGYGRYGSTPRLGWTYAYEALARKHGCSLATVHQSLARCRQSEEYRAFWREQMANIETIWKGMTGETDGEDQPPQGARSQRAETARGEGGKA